MNHEELAGAREALELEEEDEDHLEVQKKQEKKFEKREKLLLYLAGWLSAICGFGIGYQYGYLRQTMTYPGGSFDPPGGHLLPFAVFGSATLTGVGFGNHRITENDFPGKKRQLRWLTMAIPVFILAYILSYIAGFVLSTWANSFMYGVYSRDQEVVW